MVNVSEFQVHFNVAVFIKFMIYHILLFYVGPISCLFVLIFDTKHTINNMSFWISTQNKGSFVVQMIQWVSCIIVLGSWFQKDVYEILPIQIKLKHIYIEEFYFFNLMVLIRAFIIAVRYGFTSNFRLSMLTKHSQDFKYIA